MVLSLVAVTIYLLCVAYFDVKSYCCSYDSLLPSKVTFYGVSPMIQ